MWLKLIIMLIPLIVTSISPALREFIATTLDEAEERAKTTDNPWDDALVKLLKGLIFGQTN